MTANGFDGYGDWAGELSDAHLLCRDIGHRWQAARAFQNEGGTFERVLRCSRCHTERTQTITRDGYTGGNSYTYPAGYLAPKGIGSYDVDARADLRMASILRLIEKG